MTRVQNDKRQMLRPRAVLARLLLAVGVLLCAGCQAMGIEIGLRGDRVITVRVILSEAELNQSIAEAIEADPDTFLQSGTVDFAPGRITLNGVFNTGTGTADGTLVFGLSAPDGQLNIRVETVELTGYDAQSAEVLSLAIDIGRMIDNRVMSETAAVQAEATPVAEATPDVGNGSLINNLSITSEAIEFNIEIDVGP